MQVSRRFIGWTGAVLSAAGFVAIGIQVIRLWCDPLAWGDVRWIGYMPHLLMAEFALLVITLVVAGLCSRTPQPVYKALISAGFLALFFAPSIFVARMLGDDPLADYLLILIAARFLVLLGSSASGYEDLLGHSALAAVVFVLVILGMLLVTALVPMPLGGMDAALLERLDLWNAETAWAREPQRAMATIVVYCAAMVWVELGLVGPRESAHRT